MKVAINTKLMYFQNRRTVISVKKKGIFDFRMPMYFTLIEFLKCFEVTCLGNSWYSNNLEIHLSYFLVQMAQLHWVPVNNCRDEVIICFAQLPLIFCYLPNLSIYKIVFGKIFWKKNIHLFLSFCLKLENGNKLMTSSTAAIHSSTWLYGIQISEVLISRFP